MADEFEKIMGFFDLSPEDKENRLQDIFDDSVEYFERFKHIMVNGTPEEKKKAIERVMVMKKRIEEETRRVCEKTGMSEEQIAQFSNNPKNFSTDQWESIENAKNRLEKGVNDIVKAAQKQSNGPTQNKEIAENKEHKSKKKRKKPKNWIPS